MANLEADLLFKLVDRPRSPSKRNRIIHTNDRKMKYQRESNYATIVIIFGRRKEVIEKSLCGITLIVPLITGLPDNVYSIHLTNAMLIIITLKS